MNEPNLATIGGAPKGYDAAAYARDVRVFGKFIREAAPGAVFLGPGSVAEGGALAGPAIAGRLTTEDLLKATGPVYDVFSYHLYPAVSQRCTSEGPAQARAAGTTAQAALSHEWLSRPAKIDAFYTNLRDRFEPGKPIWITETGDSACGGNPWGSTFLDTFRYLIQHGVLAQRGVQVIAHNTLAASDYGLLDEKTYDPRPNYWAAVLWSRLMGPTVLNPGVVSENGLYIYAHCMRDRRGGVTVLAINTRPASDTVETSTAGEKYALTAKKLESTAVELNGSAMRLGPHDTLPALTETPFHAGRLSLEPTSITFLAFPQAANSACQ
jgi:hypothetical protein